MRGSLTFRSLARLIYFGGSKNELPGVAKRGVVLETISLMRRIALTGTDEDKAAAEQMLGSVNEKLKRADQQQGGINHDRRPTYGVG